MQSATATIRLCGYAALYKAKVNHAMSLLLRAFIRFI
jgi:hypothetical protein